MTQFVPYNLVPYSVVPLNYQGIMTMVVLMARVTVGHYWGLGLGLGLGLGSRSDIIGD